VVESFGAYHPQGGDMHFGAAESGDRRGARVGLGPRARRETCSLGADFSEQAATEGRAAREAHQDRCVRVVLECLVSAVSMLQRCARQWPAL